MPVPSGSPFFWTLAACLTAGSTIHAGVVAAWPFDEPRQSNPGVFLKDCSPNSHVMVLGRGARVVPGKFGNALEPGEPATLELSGSAAGATPVWAKLFGTLPPRMPPGRHILPLWWGNATFAGLISSRDSLLDTVPDITDTIRN